ncbi:hypothetical protein ACC719_35780, partial [Rhizobium ruizarguesonis]
AGIEIEMPRIRRLRGDDENISVLIVPEDRPIGHLIRIFRLQRRGDILPGLVLTKLQKTFAA